MERMLMKIFCTFILVTFFFIHSARGQYVYRLPESKASNFTQKNRDYKPGKSAPKFFKEDPFVQCIGKYYFKSKNKDPSYKRAGYSFQYGPEVIITLFSPVKFSLDVFPFGNTIYIGGDLSGNALDGFWGNIGGHIGYQYKALLFQLDGDLTYVEVSNLSGQQLSLNPKIGIVYNGVFVKAGPSFTFAYTTEQPLDQTFNFPSVLSFPLNFELGYYIKLSY